MNAPLLPEVLLPQEKQAQAALPLAAEGVQRVVWESRFGVILIEVKGGQTFVNSQLVLPAEGVGGR